MLLLLASGALASFLSALRGKRKRAAFGESAIERRLNDDARRRALQAAVSKRARAAKEGPPELAAMHSGRGQCPRHVLWVPWGRRGFCSQPRPTHTSRPPLAPMLTLSYAPRVSHTHTHRKEGRQGKARQGKRSSVRLRRHSDNMDFMDEGDDWVRASCLPACVCALCVCAWLRTMQAGCCCRRRHPAALPPCPPSRRPQALSHPHSLSSFNAEPDPGRVSGAAPAAAGAGAAGGIHGDGR